MKNFLLFLVMLAGLATARAQSEINVYDSKPKETGEEADDKKVKLPPVKMGFTFATHVDYLSSETLTNDMTKNRVSGAWGFVTNLQLKALAPNYYLSTGFNINSLSARVLGNASENYLVDKDTVAVVGDHEHLLRLKYFDLPLMLHLETGTANRRFALFGDIGFNVGYLLKSRALTTHTPADLSPDEFATEVRDDMRKVRADFVVGGGIGLPIDGQSMICVNIRYNYGLTCITNTDKPAIPELKLSSLNYLSFGLAVLF